jgi:hypothetical protein
MSENTAAPAPAAEPADVQARVSVEHFCALLSQDMRKNSVEMLGGFCHDRKRAGHLSDTIENFQAAFAEFANAPA